MTEIYIPEIIIGRDFLEKVTPLIESAKVSIKIIVYEWRLYKNVPRHPVMLLVSKIQEASKRGVSVQILIKSNALRRELQQLGFQCKIIESDKLVHAKMMLIDDRVVVIGSHNYTQNAFTQNLEISMALDLGTDFNDLRVYFNNLWGL